MSGHTPISIIEKVLGVNPAQKSGHTPISIYLTEKVLGVQMSGHAHSHIHIITEKVLGVNPAQMSGHTPISIYITEKVLGVNIHFYCTCARSFLLGYRKSSAAYSAYPTADPNSKRWLVKFFRMPVKSSSARR